jgi:hypothetical protein
MDAELDDIRVSRNVHVALKNCDLYELDGGGEVALS